VQDFQKPFLSSPDLIDRQMATGRHGGRKASWNAVLNYGFLDGHAQTLRLNEVYTSSAVNRFNPAVAK
jgi:prepilin-type processing-associated H-X9-DG protein